MAQAAVVVPFPPDVYYVALEEYLLHNALHILTERQGRKTAPPAAGLALRNDLIQLGMELLEEPELLEFLWYAEELGRSTKKCLDTHMPFPYGQLSPQLPRAEQVAHALLADATAPIWCAVRQAVAEVEWVQGRHAFMKAEQPHNLTLGAFANGPHCGICRGTREHASFCRLLNRFVCHLKPDHVWSTFALNLNARLPPHKDNHNAPTGSLILSLSHHEGGSVWLEESPGRQGHCPNAMESCGKMYRITFQALFFQAHRQVHCTCDWDRANRITLTAYCIGTYQHLSASHKSFFPYGTGLCAA